MTPRSPWTPSRREQHVLWVAQALMRYVVGGGGLVWAMVTDHLDPVVILVLGALATSTDVFGFIHELLRTAREEKVAVDQAIERERSEP